MPIGAILPATTHLLQVNLANQPQVWHPPFLPLPVLTDDGTLGQNPGEPPIDPMGEFMGQLELIRHKWQLPSTQDTFHLQNQLLQNQLLPLQEPQNGDIPALRMGASNGLSQPSLPGQNKGPSAAAKNQPSAPGNNASITTGRSKPLPAQPPKLTAPEIRIWGLNSPPDDVILATMKRKENE